MVWAADDHKFNDDLLLGTDDRKLASEKYGSIYHVLDHPELRCLFSEYNIPANIAKRNSQRAGILSILFGFLALTIAAAELPSINASGDHSRLEPFPTTQEILALASGLCALSGFLIGSVGLLFSKRKREWLHHRLMGESIRQFHFQMLVFRLPQILASLKDDESKATFMVERALWFDTFKQRFIGKLDSAFVAVLRNDKEPDLWLHERSREAVSMRETRALDALFEAYRELRILHQISYSNYKLDDDRRVFSKRPIRQMRTFAQVNLALIILLVAIHAAILLGALLPTSIWHAFEAGGVATVIIAIALAALAVRAVEAGLQPEREVERYQQYGSAVQAIRERYDEAPNQAAKLAVMHEMERASFDEMRNFLITNDRSRFVM